MLVNRCSVTRPWYIPCWRLVSFRSLCGQTTFLFPDLIQLSSTSFSSLHCSLQSLRRSRYLTGFLHYIVAILGLHLPCCLPSDSYRCLFPVASRVSSSVTPRSISRCTIPI